MSHDNSSRIDDKKKKEAGIKSYSGNDVSYSGNKNIIGHHCKISGNSTVGDNSGNSKSNKGDGNIKGDGNNKDNKNVIEAKSSSKDPVVGHNSGNQSTQIEENIVGDNKGNNPHVKRKTKKDGRKNSIDKTSEIHGIYIVGDNSGNIGDNPNCSRNNNVDNFQQAGFHRKNFIEHDTEIKGNSIVGDHSGNSGNIDDKPSGGGNNNMNNLLQAGFDNKNVIEERTTIRRNSIVGDVSGNNSTAPTAQHQQSRRQEGADKSVEQLMTPGMGKNKRSLRLSE